MTLETLVAKIADRYCANGLPKVIENTNKVQHDCHNCGVYVNNYFEQRLSGKSMKEISSNFNSYASTMDMRHRMIENIVNNWREI